METLILAFNLIQKKQKLGFWTMPFTQTADGLPVISRTSYLWVICTLVIVFLLPRCWDAAVRQHGPSDRHTTFNSTMAKGFGN